MKRRSTTVAAVLLATILMPLTAQINLDEARAAEEFRFGVQAFHAARYTDAVVAFQRALAFGPTDFLAREWLGRSYAHAGFMEAAVGEWRSVIANQGAGAYLTSRVEALDYRLQSLPLRESDTELAVSDILVGVQEDATVFHRPLGLTSEPNGDIFIVSLASQEVLRVSPNGRVRRRLRGGLEGLDQPFDVAWHDGRVFVTEFGANRVSVLAANGSKELVMGQRGIAGGGLLGPQYVAVDEAGFVYVTDWGNRSVTRFAPDGAAVARFGQARGTFGGLHRPTGIAVRDGSVYVADSTTERAVIHVFDTAGNYFDTLTVPVPLDTLSATVSRTGIEAIDWFDATNLLVVSGGRILIFDPRNESIIGEIDDFARQRLIGVTVDANGRVLASDHDASEVVVFEPEGVLYAGLDVTIERVLNREYPQVAVQVKVHDREDRPIVGLDSSNFVISERGIIQDDVRFEAAVGLLERFDTAVVVQAGDRADYAVDAAQAVFDLATVLPTDGGLRVYSGTREPRQIADTTVNAERMQIEVRREVERNRVPELDSAIRLAASSLLTSGRRRNLVLVGDARVPDFAFSRFGLEETAAFLWNNGIRLHLITTRLGSPDPELQFLVAETGGTTRYLYEPTGLLPLVDDFGRAPSGRYWLSYTSEANGDFGRAYIEVSVEAQLLVRSGRDEAGFFAPADS